MNILQWAKEGLKARKRGEVRVAPRAATGRVFAQKNEVAPAGHAAKVKPVGTMTARVWRADKQVWEDMPGTHDVFVLKEVKHG